MQIRIVKVIAPIVTRSDFWTEERYRWVTVHGNQRTFPFPFKYPSLAMCRRHRFAISCPVQRMECLLSCLISGHFPDTMEICASTYIRLSYLGGSGLVLCIATCVTLSPTVTSRFRGPMGRATTADKSCFRSLEIAVPLLAPWTLKTP
jgi:hypothetical protein